MRLISIPDKNLKKNEKLKNCDAIRIFNAGHFCC